MAIAVLQRQSTYIYYVCGGRKLHSHTMTHYFALCGKLFAYVAPMRNGSPLMPDASEDIRNDS